MKQKLTEIWCWIIGHNIIKIYRNFNERSYWTVHKCVRCDKRWQEQWDE